MAWIFTEFQEGMAQDEEFDIITVYHWGSGEELGFIPDGKEISWFLKKDDAE